jgi:hypothetical protein
VTGGDPDEACEMSRLSRDHTGRLNFLPTGKLKTETALRAVFLFAVQPSLRADERGQKMKFGNRRVFSQT